MRPYFSLRIVIVTALAFLLTGGAYYVLAFTETTANPPLGNVVAPLTTGSSTQQRAGQLELIGLPGIKLLLGNAFSIGARDSVGNPRTILFPLTASDNTAINFGPGGNLIINNSAGVERMRITSVGNVGIGTGSPGRKLSVGSNLHSAGDGMTLDGVLALAWGTSVPTPAAGNAFIWHESSDGSIRFKDSGGDTNLVIDDGGNVGIGTAGPNYKLDISGASGMHIGNGNYDANVVFGNVGAWQSCIRVYDNGQAEMRIWNRELTGEIVLVNGYSGDQSTVLPTDGLWVKSNNVGIGNFSVTVPGYKLDVSGDTRTSRLRFYGEGGDSSQGNCYYCIYQESGAWVNPYPDLRIQYHTGIKMEAYSGYGGIQFYDGYDGTGNPASLAFAVGNGDQTVHSYQNFYAPIMYDENDSGYYLDPNGTSNMNLITGSTRARLGLPDVWTNRPSITGDTNYWTGSQGWGFIDMNSGLPEYGSTFFDVWGTDMPGSPWSGYAHIQCLQALHYWNGTTGYGSQIAFGTSGNRTMYMRSIWGGGWGGWVGICMADGVNCPAAAASGWTDDGAVVRLTTISDNVGIGTASPREKLDVNAAIMYKAGRHDNLVQDPQFSQDTTWWSRSGGFTYVTQDLPNGTKVKSARTVTAGVGTTAETFEQST